MEKKIKKCVIEKKRGEKHVTISPKYVFEGGKKKNIIIENFNYL